MISKTELASGCLNPIVVFIGKGTGGVAAAATLLPIPDSHGDRLVEVSPDFP